MKKALVTFDVGYGRAIEGLVDVTSDINLFLEKPEEFELVLFTGGADVSPELYGDTSPLGMCFTSIQRDIVEKKIFEHAHKHNIKMCGICRGTQFINVMTGGTMMHDVNNHAGSHHKMYTYNGELEVNSAHHQMCLPAKDSYIIGWAENVATSFIGAKDMPVDHEGPQVEAIIVPEFNCCGVQYHPEWMPIKSDGYKFYWEMIAYFLENGIEALYNKYRNHDVAVV